MLRPIKPDCLGGDVYIQSDETTGDLILTTVSDIQADAQSVIVFDPEVEMGLLNHLLRRRNLKAVPDTIIESTH